MKIFKRNYVEICYKRPRLMHPSALYGAEKKRARGFPDSSCVSHIQIAASFIFMQWL